MPERKARFEEFCRSHYVPIHLQPWWLDAVCVAGAWNVCVAADKSGAILGVLPWYLTRKAGFPVILQAPLTAYTGAWLSYPSNPNIKPQSRYSFEKKVFDELIGQLPDTAFFQQNFYPDITNWLPFYWAGFRQTTRYTYIFNDLQDLEKIKAGFKNTLRTDLKKAEQAVEIQREDGEARLLFRLHEMSFGRKNRRPPYSFDTFLRLHTALSERRQSACFIARDSHSGEPHAGLYLVFDAQRASVLITGADPAFKSSCAVWILFWEAMRFCSERGLSFDFEGSMEKDIERAFRAFGAQLTPYHQIWKAGNKLFEAAYLLRD